MNVRYRVELSEAERGELTALLRGGRPAARTLKRAQILLATDAGDSEAVIARHIAVSAATVCRTQRRCVEGTLERALYEAPRLGMARLLSGRCEKSAMGLQRNSAAISGMSLALGNFCRRSSDFWKRRSTSHNAC